MLSTVEKTVEYQEEAETLETEQKELYDSDHSEKFWEAITFISAQNQFFVSRIKRIL